MRCRLHLIWGAKILDALLRSRACRVNKSTADEGGKQGNQKQEADFKALPYSHIRPVVYTVFTTLNLPAYF